jgi:hypothetical protein
MKNRKIGKAKIFPLMAVLVVILFAPAVGMALLHDWGNGAKAPSSDGILLNKAQGVERVPMTPATGDRSGAHRSGLTAIAAAEPSTMMLLGTALIGLAVWGRKKFRE